MPAPDPAGVQTRPPITGDTVAEDVQIPDPDDEAWRRTRVAVADGRCVGAASLFFSPVTDSYFCEVTVTPAYRRRGIGTRLYAAVHETADPRFPVLARAMRSQPLRRQFAEAIGCSILFSCPEPWVDPTSADGQEWVDRQALPTGYDLVAMAELPLEQVGQAWANCFAWTHRSFGTVHRDRLPAVWARLSGGFDPAASIVAVDASTGEIVALSLVTPDAWDGRTMVISETIGRDQPDGDRLHASTVAASLRVLGSRGVRRVELEGHTTDAHFPALVRSLPPAGGDPMDVLTLSPPKPDVRAGRGVRTPSC